MLDPTYLVACFVFGVCLGIWLYSWRRERRQRELDRRIRELIKAGERDR